MTDPIGPIRAAIVGRYEIEREIGQGAFATVYLARDLRHDRFVAIKVLNADPTSENSELRFLREIRLLARLQHPNILPLIDSGHAEAMLYYVMPYVSGESLRDRIHRERQLAVESAIAIAHEAADALACAHEQGIIHRDIKPENILLSAGHPMIADFGVARAIDLAGVRQLTRTGVGTPGTPAYMSPEQMLGDTQVDQRSDIYSLGCVLYEMLTGKPPFPGKDGFVKRFTEPPPLPSTMRRSLSPTLDTIVTKALSRDPKDRYPTAAAFAQSLSAASHTLSSPEQRGPPPTLEREAAVTPSGGTVPIQVVAATAPVRVSGQRKKNLVFAGAATLLLAVSLIASRYLGGSRQMFEVGATQQITNDPGVEFTPALSPDGKMLAYAGGEPANTSIFVRQVSGGEAIRVASGRAPQWSPDGSTLVYVDSAGIAMAPALGGSPQRLIGKSEGVVVTSPVWSHDGKLLAYTEDDAIWITANADGTEPRKIMTAKEPHSLSWSPDNTRLAFIQGNRAFIYVADRFGNLAPSTLWTVGRDGKGAAPLTDEIHHSVSPVWTSDGDGILYVSNIRGGRDLYYQRVRGNRADGPPQRLTTGLKIHGIAVGGEGRIAYSVWNTSVGIWSLPFPRSGTASIATAKQLTSATERIEWVRPSPDGQWLAFDSDRSGNMDIYKMRIDGTGLQQLTRNPADDFRPSWSPDGRQFAFHSLRNGNRDLYVMSADGSAERIIAGGPAHEWGGAWSPDGSQLAFWSNRTGRQEIDVVPATGGNARRLTSEGGVGPLWSRDGKFLAYWGLDFSLRVIPAQGGREKVLVAPAIFGAVVAIGGWSTDSRKIYFRVLAPDGSLNIAQVSLDGSNPSLLVRFDVRERRGYRSDFSADGKTIYLTVGKHEADIWVMDFKKR